MKISRRKSRQFLKKGWPNSARSTPTEYVHCRRFWFKHAGRCVRMVCLTDYLPFEIGEEQRLYYMLVDRTRCAGRRRMPSHRGQCMSSHEGWFAERILPIMKPGQWVEFIYGDDGDGAILVIDEVQPGQWVEFIYGDDGFVEVDFK